MAVWSSVRFSKLGGRVRLDPEFYQPHLLQYERELTQSGLKVVPLGEIAAHGYRVIYENTEIVGEPEDSSRYVRFLQAAQLSSNFPAISAGSIGWVSRNDWVRYPQGRICRGEILIEVKGLAEKVAIVPDDFPLDTLVTGTLFKLTVNEEKIDPYYLLCYLLSKYGKGFRERCLTNTLIGFVSKEELYAIPIPLPNRAIQRRIGDMSRRAVSNHEDYKRQMVDAETLVSRTLGLDKMDTAPSVHYSSKFLDLQAANRFGAEYFMPCKQRVLEALEAKPGRLLGEHCLSVRDPFNAAGAQRGDQVRNFDLTDALEPVLDDRIAPMSAVEVGSTKKKLQSGDVVISRLRSYLREIALVRTAPDVSAVGSSEFIVLRPREKEKSGLSPETLLVYLRSLPVQTILKWSQDGSQHPRFTEEDLLAIPVPQAVERVASRVDKLVNEALVARTEAAKLLQLAIAEVERLVLGEAK